MAYDELRGRAVLFGGFSTVTTLGDTWEWDGLRWMSRTLAVSPSARTSHAMVYDVARRRVILFGGGNPSPVQDTWEWDGAHGHGRRRQ